MNIIFDLISKFNKFSDTQNYIRVFFISFTIIFVASYICNILFEKPCNNSIGSIIVMIHHLFIFLIFYGFLAPISILWIMLIILIISFFSWS